MSDAIFFVSLEELDARLQQVAHLLVRASDGDLVTACDELHKQVGAFQALWQKAALAPPVPIPLALRLRKTAAALASVQQNLARRAVLTQQTLQTLFPATQSDTYSVGVGARARKPYGSAGRQSGEFQAVCA